jgi:germination protein YpeB
MGKIKEKVYDWKNRLKDRHMLTLVVVLVTVIAIMGIYVYKREREYRQVSENNYNMAFFELVDYVQNVETYLAKSLISSTPEHGAETLTHVWREANLAQSYLARLPIGSEELANTSKFLNQVSDYSFSLSRKNIYNESLTQEDFKNLKELHDYSVELENTLNQLSADMNDGRIKWGELTNKGSSVFATQVSNISKDSFSNLEENFHEYAGLIYDGAFSEHLTSTQRKGLTGDNIEEEQAKQIAIHFLGADKIKEITANGISENTNMPAYDFSVKINGDQDKENSATISITQKGGHVIFMNYNREVEAETISQERADEIGKNFLAQKEFPNIKETYYLKQDGIVTINYASYQDSENGQVTMYPDLIKLKIALDNGEIMGIETTGYLNSHEQRNLPEVTITKEQAKQNLNKDLEIGSQALAVIPTQFQTEILCWEFKGKVDDTEFLVYINAQTGKEEDILVIKNTPNGTLTM